MASYKRFEDLPIWQEARDYSKKVFWASKEGEFSKEYRLCSQIRASSGSIMDNIAEGFERNGNGEFKQFLYVAKGSCGESRSQLYRAFDYGYLPEDQFEALKSQSEEISKSKQLYRVFAKFGNQRSKVQISHHLRSINFKS